MPEPASAATPEDARALLRSRSYVQLLVLAALLGAPVSAIAYWFLKLVDWLQGQAFTSLPKALGLGASPTWWPLPVLALAGLLCAASIRYLPGTGGHSPADGFRPSGPVPPEHLGGVFAAAVATLSLGVVLGPEAPLIAIGSGLGVLAVRIAARDAPDRAAAMLAAAGSFAAISSLLGSPLLGAFLLLEASGLGGPTLGIVLVPGLLAAGIGSLVFIGLDSLTGFGTFSLTIPGLPPVGSPTGAWFGYAIAIGIVAPFLGAGVRWLALLMRSLVQPRMLLLMPVLGLAIAGLAIGFDQATSKGISQVLFSGENQLGPLLDGAGGWSAGALLALVACKGLAYALSLSSFRGGPVFPSMFIGAAVGLVASHLPGLPDVAGAAIGIGAMCAVMLSLPLTSVLLATLLLGSDGVKTIPVVIVAVVVAYVVSARIAPRPPPEPEASARRAEAPPEGARPGAAVARTR